MALNTRPRRSAEVARSIGVLSRQRNALRLIARRLEAAGFAEAARSVDALAAELTDLAAAADREAAALREAEGTQRQRARQSRAAEKTGAASDFAGRVYASGPCPDCGAATGTPCHVFRAPRGSRGTRRHLGEPASWPHHGRVRRAHALGAFDDYRRG